MEAVPGIVPQNFVMKTKKHEPGKETITEYHNMTNVAKITSREYFGEDKMKGSECDTAAYDAYGNKLFESKMDARTVIALLNGSLIGQYNTYDNHVLKL